MAFSRVRCAIYTRKSTEEGLDQAFNSLHAQREACEAYVLSQTGEGWTALPQLYDDGGFSGGTMDRPALARLLADVAAGKIDTIVVYKIDRLTRSLNDFAKIVEVLDKAGASFVSVTQAFNTTTSMGRLTLNVLLSFAQFEREVTGERIRDKIAASKAKGMWMGGNLPLGYHAPTDPQTRALIVNTAEAETVRLIFSKYLELGSVRALEAWLAAELIRSKVQVSAMGRTRGGVVLSRGALFHLLRNRVYLGEIVHKGTGRPGAHAAVIERDLFEAVQAKLASQVVRHRERVSKAGRAALTGLLFDAANRPMSPCYAIGRSGRAYRYYASAPLQQGRSADADETLRRIPAEAIEAFVRDAVGRILGRSVADTELKAVLLRVELDQDEARLRVPAAAFGDGRQDSAAVLAIVRRRLGEDARVSAVGDQDVHIGLPAVLKTRGGRAWFAQGGAPARLGKIDPTLLSGLSSAHRVVSEMGVRSDGRPDELNEIHSPSNAYKRALAPLAFLAPEIQVAIATGQQPAGLRLEHLVKSKMPLAWADQKALFGL